MHRSRGASGSSPSRTRSAAGGRRSCSRSPRSPPCRTSTRAGGLLRREAPSASAASVPWRRRRRRTTRTLCSSSPSERDVVVGRRRREVRARVGRARGNELAVAAALGVAAAAEELDGVRDDLHRLPLGAVLRLPLAPVESAVDADRAALRQVLRTALALVPPDGDVEVVRLVAPLARRPVLLARIDGDAELADGGPARRVPELGVPRQVPDEDDAVDIGHG